jgi:hypothetical protein
MKICTGQPIPKGYVVDSVTTIPACQCLGVEDNAYVIRYVSTGDEADLSRDPSSRSGDSPYVDSENNSALDSEDATKLSEDATKLSFEARYPYGDPPFGNFLCARNTMEPQPYGNSFPGQSNNTNLNGLQPPAGPLSQQPTLSPSWDYPPSPPSWKNQQSEPFRIGQ